MVMKGLHSLWGRTLLALGATAPLGCAADLARASSSAIGCAYGAIEISDVSVGWSRMSWRARCNGSDFYCSGESNADCAPASATRPPAPEAERSPGLPTKSQDNHND